MVPCQVGLSTACAAAFPSSRVAVIHGADFVIDDGPLPTV